MIRTFINHFFKAFLRHNLLFVISLLWLILISPSFFKPMVSFDADAYSRLGQALYPAIDDVWLPFHQIILRIPLIVYSGSYYVSARILCSLAILFTSLYLYLAVYNLSKSRFFSLFAAAAFLFHPLVIDIAPLTFTEPLWIFFTASGFYYVFFHRNFKGLLLGLCLWGLGQGIRYESWYLTPLLFFVIIPRYKKEPKIIFMSLILVLLVPLYWTVFTYLHYHAPFHYIYAKWKGANVNSTREFGNFNASFGRWYEVLSTTIFPGSIILLFIFSLVFVRGNIAITFSLVPIYMYALLVLQVYLKSMENFAPRFLFVLIPSAIVTIAASFARFKKTIPSKFSSLLIILPVFVFMAYLNMYRQKIYPLYQTKNPETEDIELVAQAIDVSISKTDYISYLKETMTFTENHLVYLLGYNLYVKPFNCSTNTSYEPFAYSEDSRRSINDSTYVLVRKQKDTPSCSSLVSDLKLIYRSDIYELYSKTDL